MGKFLDLEQERALGTVIQTIGDTDDEELQKIKEIAVEELFNNNILNAYKTMHDFIREYGLSGDGRYPLDDLRQQASLGLLRGISRYDPRVYKNKLYTYAKPFVRKALQNGLSSTTNLCLSICGYWSLRAVRDTRDFSNENETNKELDPVSYASNKTGWSKDFVFQLMQLGTSPIYIDEQIDLGEGKVSLEEIIPNEANEGSKIDDDNKLSKLTLNLLKELTDREIKIISYEYELDPILNRIPFEEFLERMEITKLTYKREVKRIENKMREYAEKNNLKISEGMLC